MLEIVVSLLNKECGLSDSTVASGTTPSPPAKECPSVSVLSDGRGILVESNPAAGRGVRGRLSLTLPQRVVPDSAKSFFWKGDLTVRAVLAV